MVEAGIPNPGSRVAFREAHAGEGDRRALDLAYDDLLSQFQGQVQSAESLSAIPPVAELDSGSETTPADVAGHNWPM